eukprot:Hpha_TRINITY_DN16629_c3_g7::TRINITY_DN16629_c3_g7_i1::g.183000::m.183000
MTDTLPIPIVTIMGGTMQQLSEDDVKDRGGSVIFLMTGDTWAEPPPPDASVEEMDRYIQLGSTLSPLVYTGAMAGAVRAWRRGEGPIPFRLRILNASNGHLDHPWLELVLSPGGGYALVKENEIITITFGPGCAKHGLPPVTPPGGMRVAVIETSGIKNAQEGAQTAATAAAGAAGVLGAQPGAATGMARVTSLLQMKCGTEEDVLDPEATPLVIEGVSSSPLGQYDGAVVGSIVLIAVPMVAHFLVYMGAVGFVAFQLDKGAKSVTLLGWTVR